MINDNTALEDAFNAGRETNEWNEQTLRFIETFYGEISDLFPYKYKTFEDYKKQTMLKIDEQGKK